MSKQANPEILKALINTARQNDAVLNGIINAAQNVVKLDNAASYAVALGNVLLNQNQSDDAVAAAMVNGFKAILYADWTVATNQRLNDANMHNNLINMRNQIINGLSSQGTVNPAVQGNGTSIFTTAPAQNASIFSGDNGGGSIFTGGSNTVNVNTTAAVNVDNIFGAATAAKEPEAVFATAPQAPKPVAAPMKVAVAETKTQRVHNVEKYEDHELSFDYATAAVPPRRANEAIKLYSQNNNWGDVLNKALDEGKKVIAFGDSDVVGKLMEHRHTFIGYDANSEDIMRTLINSHNLAINELRDLELEDDTGVIMTRVMSVVDALRKATTNYIDGMSDACAENHTILMDALNLAAVYQERLSRYLEVGFRIGSNGFKAPNGRAFSIDNVVTDLKDFATGVYGSFCDGNGVCSEDDYFRDLFLTVGRAIAKLQIIMDDEGAVHIVSTKYMLMTSGEFGNISKDTVVSANTFGPALSTVISDVYHRLNDVLPNAWVLIRTPHQDVVLLASDDGSIIRY